MNADRKTGWEDGSQMSGGTIRVQIGYLANRRATILVSWVRVSVRVDYL